MKDSRKTFWRSWLSRDETDSTHSPVCSWIRNQRLFDLLNWRYPVEDLQIIKVEVDRKEIQLKINKYMDAAAKNRREKNIEKRTSKINSGRGVQIRERFRRKEMKERRTNCRAAESLRIDGATGLGTVTKRDDRRILTGRVRDKY